jgi:hypothetical protein
LRIDEEIARFLNNSSVGTLALIVVDAAIFWLLSVFWMIVMRGGRLCPWLRVKVFPGPFCTRLGPVPLSAANGREVGDRRSSSTW